MFDRGWMWHTWRSVRTLSICKYHTFDVVYITETGSRETSIRACQVNYRFTAEKGVIFIIHLLNLTVMILHVRGLLHDVHV